MEIVNPNGPLTSKKNIIYCIIYKLKKYSLHPKLFGLVRKIQLFRKTSLTTLFLLLKKKKKLKIS